MKFKNILKNISNLFNDTTGPPRLRNNLTQFYYLKAANQLNLN